MQVVRVQGNGFGPPAHDHREPLRAGEDGVADSDAGYPLVLVTWHDAWFDFDQKDPEDCRPDYVVRTVGFLVNDGARFVSLAQEVLPDGDGFRAITHIPRSIIESISTLFDGSQAVRPEGV